MLANGFATAKSLQSCLTLCDPINGSPPGSPIPGILQAGTLEWAAISFSNAWKWKVKVKSLQSCPTLSDPMDCSLPGSSIHGNFQARVLECGAIAFSFISIICWNAATLQLTLRTKLSMGDLECPGYADIYRHRYFVTLDVSQPLWRSAY